MGQETLAEARQSENLLIGPEREELQVALKWAGHYDGPIDAAFGRGTRGAMASWQSANGYEDTGVLTTGQREELLRQGQRTARALGSARRHAKIYRGANGSPAVALPPQGRTAPRCLPSSRHLHEESVVQGGLAALEHPA